MKRFLVYFLLLTGGSMLISCSPKTEPKSLLDGMGMPVTVEENREIAWTDKKSGYYYTQTHLTETGWFSGWNVSTHRIFSDYSLSVDGKILNRKDADVTVFPDRMVRQFPAGKEIFRLFDDQPVLGIFLDDISGKETGLLLNGDLKFISIKNETALFSTADPRGWFLAVSTMNGSQFTSTDSSEKIWLSTEKSGGGFLIGLDSTEVAVSALLDSARKNHQSWVASRRDRMENLLTSNFFKSNNPHLDLALRWNILSLDALITRQTGYGIYAGLPWFNDYWGRDMFISLPGTALVTGQFDVARKILLSFAEYQNKDEKSPFFGRVPNRVRPEDILYNTTDGTPRFIISLMDYIRYSGDTSLVKELYPVIKRSIEGPLKYWVDENGYLTHDDADTWMDAKIDNKIPLSPRGNRANDIQTLWYDQLLAGVRFAQLSNDRESAEKWQKVADKLKSRFLNDFLNPAIPALADRLRKNGTADFSFRPNQLFALDFITNDSLKWVLTRKVWEELVYPWGVASLSQFDPNFYPYHTSWEHYPANFHKDWAYHNGTVWLWNNGIAMQRMLEGFQYNPAYELFSSMSHQTLNAPGAVGALSELTDALPPKDAKLPRLSGTFSQAWSMAEYLRVWYQGFLGIQPDALNNQVILQPQLPDSIFSMDFQVPLFSGILKGSFHRTADDLKFMLEPDSLNSDVTFIIKFPGFEPVPVVMYAGEKLLLNVQKKELSVKLFDTLDEVRAENLLFRVKADEERIELAKRIFKDVQFAKPVVPTDYSRMQQAPVWK